MENIGGTICLNELTDEQIKSFKRAEIKVPKVKAKIFFCGMHVLNAIDDSDFVMPTPEQRKNLKEMLCIEVEEVEEQE